MIIFGPTLLEFKLKGDFLSLGLENFNKIFVCRDCLRKPTSNLCHYLNFKIDEMKMDERLLTFVIA